MLDCKFSDYGSAIIKGFEKGKTVFLQGDDAAELHKDLAGCTTKRQVQDVLSEYSVIAN